MFLVLVVVGIIASSVWVLVDAESHQVPMSKGKPYSPSNGSAAWFIGCLLLWIIGFPWYLIARSAVLAEGRSIPPTATLAASPPTGAALLCSTCGTSLAAGARFCHVCASPAPVPVALAQSADQTPFAPVGPPAGQPAPLPVTNAQPAAQTSPAPAESSSWQWMSAPVVDAQPLPGTLPAPAAPRSGQATWSPAAKPAKSRGWGIAVALVVTVLAIVCVVGLVHAENMHQNDLKAASAAKEGLISLQVGVQSYAVDHGDQYPDGSLVTEAGLVDQNGTSYEDSWPTNPYTGLAMQQGTGPGEFTYTTAGATFRLAVYGPNGAVLLAVP